MKVTIVAIFFLCALLENGFAKKGKSKSDNIEDTYGALVDTDADEDIQNDDLGDEYGDLDDVNSEEIANNENNEEIQAEFKTKPQTFVADIGEVIKLPCEVTDPDVVAIWQKKDTILYQGHIPMNKWNNLKEYPNNTLEVTLNAEEDFGDYVCKIIISSENNPKLFHKIVQRQPPRITSLLAVNNETVYQVGESLTLTCRAEGYPVPEISWYKGGTEGERLGLKGKTLTIPNLTFKDAGLYRCLADNKVKPAAHQHIQIFIEHKPVIAIEKYLVNSDKENDAELKCIVRAYPPAVVIWKRNGININAKAPKVTLKRNRDNIENILIITDLKEEDFGSYTCSASNNLDTVEKTVNLVKTPAIQEFLKPEKPNKDVVLSWKVESKAPISRHELQYRKQGENYWKDIEPEVTNGENDVYTVKYTLKGLDAGNYETRLRSQNVHGWSEYSPIMPFEGVIAKHGSAHKNHNKKHHHKEKDTKEKHISSTQDGTPAQHQEIDNKESAVGASQTAGCGTVSSSAMLISISLLAIFFRKQ